MAKKPSKIYGCQQNLINDSSVVSYLEYVCSESNDLHNCGVYFCRQILFKTGRIIKKFDVINELKFNPHYSALAAQAAQQVCLTVSEAFKSYDEALQEWFKNPSKFTGKPKPPNYRKPNGLNLIAYPKQALKLVDGMVRFPLGDKSKTWFGVQYFFIKFPSNLDWEVIKEVRILPKNGSFYAEFVYPASVSNLKLDQSRALGIDHGLGNWLTCVSNIGRSFIVDGHKVKSMTKYYNKLVANIKTGKSQNFWSEQLDIVTQKRNHQMRDAVNKAARFVISWCIKNNVGTIVFGWNKRQKDSINIGDKNNQSFVQTPTAKLKDRIEQLCKESGIRFVETEESYTSKASFLDNDFLPKFGEKPERWKESGKRLLRGEYTTAKGIKINADCNGAANILRKVSTQLGLSLDKVRKEALTLPKRYCIFKNLKQRYQARFQPA